MPLVQTLLPPPGLLLVTIVIGYVTRCPQLGGEQAELSRHVDVVDVLGGEAGVVAVAYVGKVLVLVSTQVGLPLGVEVVDGGRPVEAVDICVFVSLLAEAAGLVIG